SQGVTGLDITLTYDQDLYEYIGFTGAKESIREMATDEQEGQVRVIIGALGQGAALFDDAVVGSFTFLAKSGGTGSIVMERLLTGDRDGHEVEHATDAVQVVVNGPIQGSLEEALQLAAFKLENAEEGFAVGQYP